MKYFEFAHPLLDDTLQCPQSTESPRNSMSLIHTRTKTACVWVCCSTSIGFLFLTSSSRRRSRRTGHRPATSWSLPRSTTHQKTPTARTRKTANVDSIVERDLRRPAVSCLVITITITIIRCSSAQSCIKSDRLFIAESAVKCQKSYAVKAIDVKKTFQKK